MAVFFLLIGLEIERELYVGKLASPREASLLALAAFAVIDDLRAIVLIALFYTQGFSQPYFTSALPIFLGLLLLNRFGVWRLPIYLVPGVVMWYCLLMSGVHATLAGVLLTFVIPSCDGDETCPSNKLLHILHKPVAFVVMALFALANTGIVVDAGWLGKSGHSQRYRYFWRPTAG